MNERIRVLAQQAGFMDSWFSESGDDCERELKKFAELIVKECQACVSQYIHECGYEVASLPDSVLNRHFGVEE
jgi:hypothetical protein